MSGYLGLDYVGQKIPQCKLRDFFYSGYLSNKLFHR